MSYPASRISHVLTHCSAPIQRSPTAAGEKSPDDVVICSALRTAIGKARRGAFRDTKPDVLLRAVLKATVDATNVPFSALGDINVGNVQMGGAYAAGARMAAFTAGFPETVPLSTVNRQCSSGLQAVANIANSILSGQVRRNILFLCFCSKLLFSTCLDSPLCVPLLLIYHVGMG